MRVNVFWDIVPSLKEKRKRVDFMFAFLFLIVIVNHKVTIIRKNLGLLGQRTCWRDKQRDIQTCATGAHAVPCPQTIPITLQSGAGNACCVVKKSQ